MTTVDYVPRFSPERLRALRDEKGLSRRALSELTPGVSMQAIQAYEDGRNVPDANRLFTLATALGVTAHHLTE
jgi:transcriptional regulator with XRE-family HTH domain